MNRRSVIVTVLLLSACATGLVLLWPSSHLPAPGADALSAYVQMTYRTVVGTPSPAARPTALTTAAHTVTYGDGIYFATTHDFAGTAETTNLRALPYPPQSVLSLIHI